MAEQEVNDLFAKLSREELENETYKMIKHLKFLKKKNSEMLDALKQTEDKLMVQIQKNEELQNENETLQSQIESKASQSSDSILQLGSLSLENIGKRFTSILNQKLDNRFSFETNLDEISIEPQEYSEENPEISLLKAQINQLKQSLLKSQQSEQAIREFSATLQTKIENQEYKFEEMNKLKSELEMSQQQNKQFTEECEELRKIVKSLEEELKKTKQAASEMKAQFSTLQLASTDLQELTLKHSELKEQNEKFKSDTIQAQVKQQELERQIEQMTASLKKSIRTDQEKDEQIFGLQQQIKEMGNEKSDLELQINGYKKLIDGHESEIQSLRKEKVELETRLNSSPGTQATEARVEKMQRLIEKSNALYADMQLKAAKSEERVRQLEIQIHNEKKRGSPLMKLLTPIGNYLLYDGGTFTQLNSLDINHLQIQTFDFNSYNSNSLDNSNRTDIETETDNSDNNLNEKYEYLQSVVLRYFRSDQKVQNELMPVILSLLNLSDFEMRKLMSGNTKGYFSFF